MASHALPPSEDEIVFFNSIVPDVPRSEVIARLLANKNDVAQAVNEWYDDIDNPNGNKYSGWEEGQFNSDREGAPADHGVSFGIHAADELGPYSTFDGAPSRPPSRISNNKSPLGNMIDSTANSAGAGLPPQETGVSNMNMNQVHFGPANRGEYETGKWEMVPAGKSSAQEILHDPEPSERKRDSVTTPAFLRPSVDDHRLGALLTIYYEIPKIREVFLDRKHVLPNYGFNKEWWVGKAIERPVIYEDNEPAESDVTLELQRLMAFLDKTDRSYGSVDALANLEEVKRGQGWAQEKESAVLEAWRKSQERKSAGMVNKLFSRGVPREAEEGYYKSFAILDLVLPLNDSVQDSIYDIADEVLWPSLAPLELDQSPYLSHIADVIAFRIEGDESKKNIDIPTIWYPDRYLKDARQASLEMRLRKHDVQEELNRIALLEDRLTNFQTRSGKAIKVKDMFNASLQHDEATIENNGQGSNDATADISTSKRSSKTVLSSELRKLVSAIDEKLLVCKVEREKACEALKNLSRLYTQPSEDPDAPKLHPYFLRGISTSKSTFYVCRAPEPDLMDMNLDGDQPQAKAGQWWRLNYALSRPNPVTVEKMTEAHVLEAAKIESKNILVVYASEKAIDFKFETQALPTPLETFIHADNRAFKQELIENDDTQTQVSSPGKRKFACDEPQESVSERYNSSPKVSESATNINILEREMSDTRPSPSDGTERASQHLSPRIGHNNVCFSGHGEGEVINGVDPSLPQISGQEMQERGSNPMRLSMLGGPVNVKASTIDNMDLDEVTEDTHIATESGAVKRVGFVE
ncbi:hypothetical protein BJ875DRAFT_455983 [Amylocarpus encephaloides]|uniref:Ubiquitin interaction domain-containing protein n=1 Tax=Amylocarpus encephaloides TaxID=45428 RepID=A0A9P7YP32_9HELO|nr:hypothetical protein BJ875DRAFT_455983 [Amylocarpus encephaloides]